MAARRTETTVTVNIVFKRADLKRWRLLAKQDADSFSAWVRSACREKERTKKRRT